MVERSIRASFPADVLAKPQNEQNVVYEMVSAMAGGLSRLTPEEEALVKSDIGKFKEVLGAKGVPLAQVPQPYMVDAARSLASETATTRIWSLDCLDPDRPCRRLLRSFACIGDLSVPATGWNGSCWRR
jgi:hypothetical protein